MDWQAVAEVHEQWKHEDSGLGGPGASLLSLAMAVALSATGVGAPFTPSMRGMNNQPMQLQHSL